MHWIGRSIVVLALLVIAATMLWPNAWRGEERRPLPKQIAEKSVSPAVPLEGDSLANSDDNPYVSSLDNDLARSLDQMLASHGEVFQESQSGLQDRLEDADRRLSSIKSDIRAAMRNANRQARLPGQSSPLVMMVVLEGVAKEELGFYGQPGETPLLEGLAERGTVFQACYAGPTAEIARHMLLTGSGHRDGEDRENQLAEMMWKSGYRPLLLENTGWIETTEKRYYEESVSLSLNEANHLPEEMSLSGANVRIVANTNDDPSDDVSSARLLTKQIRHLVAHSHDRHPVFIQLHWKVTESDSELRAKQIAGIDQAVGRVFHALEEARNGRAMMMVLAGLPQEDSVEEGSSPLSEQSLQVPLMIYRSRQVGIAQVEEPCGLLDVLPTLAEAIGSSRVPRHNGISLLGWANETPVKKVTRVFRWNSPANDNQVAVRQGPWKAVFGSTQQLFFLPDDPQEQHDVAAEHQEVLETLAKHGRIKQP